MDYLVSKVTMMVTAIALSRGRHYFFCLLFFYIWALYKLGTPDPTQHPEIYRNSPETWYWICTSAECVLIFLVLKVKPNAPTLLIIASTIQIVANTVSTYTHALYDFYPTIIRTCEIAQCLTLIIWSPLVLKQLESIRTHLQGIATWMLRLIRT